MFLVIVINIFLMLLVSVMMEYNNLAQRLSLLENNISLALDRSIEASTASEELFTAAYQEELVSHGLTGGSETGAVTSSSKMPLGANMILWGGSGWYDASSYILASFYAEYGRLPATATEYHQYEQRNYVMGGGNEEFLTRAIFTWLFGQAGHNYNRYDWCNTSVNVMNALEEANIAWVNRTPNNDFKAFYDNIGKSIVVNGVVKVKDATGESFTTDYRMYPVLDNMGLDFDDDFTGDSEQNTAENDTGREAIYMTDNFCMSEHAGKEVGGRWSKYYLTPYSLGVTYVPLKVLKPVFIGNLDTMVRLQKVASGKIDDNATADFQSASECVEPTVYSGTGFVQQHHYTDIYNYSDYGAVTVMPEDNKVHIVTDGNIEYVLDTVQMRVDYFTADFYDTGYKNIAARIEGSVTGTSFSNQNDALIATVNGLKDSDTYRRAGKMDMQLNANGNRIVAKVTVRMKVHVLYQSSILQWLSYKDWKANGCTGEWHASIKEINPSTGQIRGRLSNISSYLFGKYDDWGDQRELSSDGTWFQTSTYFAVTR